MPLFSSEAGADLQIREEPATLGLVQFSAESGLVRVECVGRDGRTVRNSDDSESVTVTVTTAKSLPAYMVGLGLNAASDIPGLPNGTVKAKCTVLSGGGAICTNTGGTRDGSGTNGFADVNDAPTASSRDYWPAGSRFSVGGA